MRHLKSLLKLNCPGDYFTWVTIDNLCLCQSLNKILKLKILEIYLMTWHSPQLNWSVLNTFKFKYKQLEWIGMNKVILNDTITSLNNALRKDVSIQFWIWWESNYLSVSSWRKSYHSKTLIHLIWYLFL